MQILTDFNAIVSSLTHVIVTAATKIDSIIHKILTVGEVAASQWEADANFDATKRTSQRAADIATFEKSLLDME